MRCNPWYQGTHLESRQTFWLPHIANWPLGSTLDVSTPRSNRHFRPKVSQTPSFLFPPPPPPQPSHLSLRPCLWKKHHHPSAHSSYKTLLSPSDIQPVTKFYRFCPCTVFDIHFQTTWPLAWFIGKPSFPIVAVASWGLWASRLFSHLVPIPHGQLRLAEVG